MQEIRTESSFLWAFAYSICKYPGYANMMKYEFVYASMQNLISIFIYHSNYIEKSQSL